MGRTPDYAANHIKPAIVRQAPRNRAGRVRPIGDNRTDETGLGGAQPLYLHEEDGLIFATVKLGDVPCPFVEGTLPFQLEDYDGPQRDLLRKIRMFHNVPIKLNPENGIQSLKFRHGQSP